MRTITRVFSYALWAIVLIDVILALTISSWQITASVFMVAFVAVLWLLASLFLAGGGLALIYRRYATMWLGWIVMVALMTISWLNMQGVVRISEPRLSFLLTLVFPFVIGAFFSAIAFVLYRRDVGLRLIAAITLVDIWGLYLAWRLSGNLIEQIFTYLTRGAATSILLLNLLFCMSILLLFLAALSFVWHTLRLIHREVTA